MTRHRFVAKEKRPLGVQFGVGDNPSRPRTSRPDEPNPVFGFATHPRLPQESMTIYGTKTEGPLHMD